MCLAVPGEILSIEDSGDWTRTGRVRFGGIVKSVSLAMLPDACVGDYALVHAGLGISIIDEAEAQEIMGYLAELGAADELGEPGS